MNQLRQILLILLSTVWLTGCSHLHYYTQAVSGQLELMLSGQPVTDVVADPRTSPELRQQLETALAARTFAAERLALPVGDAYLDYVEFRRPYVVVNLMVAPEFSLEPKQWCYPVVGCQAYRGYFNPDDARDEQRRYDADGFDTFLGGVTAYSTLGWFDDPLHSGFTSLPTDRMVALLFHELSHRVVYVAGDTEFNESFATAVELEGLRLWLQSQGDEQGFERALTRLERRSQTLALVANAVADLDALYRDTAPESERRETKAAILDQLRADYLDLAVDWDEPGPLGRAPPPLNNAHLAVLRQYNRYVPAFRQLLRQHHYDFRAFYTATEALAALPADQRRERLQSLVSP